MGSAYNFSWTWKPRKPLTCMDSAGAPAGPRRMLATLLSDSLPESVSISDGHTHLATLFAWSLRSPVLYLRSLAFFLSSSIFLGSARASGVCASILASVLSAAASVLSDLESVSTLKALLAISSSTVS